MLYQLFSIVSPIVFCALIGFILAKRQPNFDVQQIGNLVLNIGAPCLIVASLSKVEIELVQFKQQAIVVMLLLTITAIVTYLCCRISNSDWRGYVPSVTFANTGNMGLSLCFFAFGEQGLALGASFFVVTCIAHFSLGVIWFGGQGSAMALVKTPMLWAALIAIAMQMTDTFMPKWLDNTVSLLGQFAIPLMLLSLGVSLARIKVNALLKPLFFASLRVFGGFAIAWGLCGWFNITGVERGVILLQATTASAVFNYVLAEKYNRIAHEVAALVVVSTLMSFAFIPVVLFILLA